MAPTTLPLYAATIPDSPPRDVRETSMTESGNRVRVSNVVQPTRTMFTPVVGMANGTSASSCPGGGYARLAIDSEGDDVAKKLNEMGVTAFVLKYNELHVSARPPLPFPTFLGHAGDDKTVPVNNRIVFCQACLRHGVPAKLHLYPRGGHGFGLNSTTTPDRWPNRLRNWLDANGWLIK